MNDTIVILIFLYVWVRFDIGNLLSVLPVIDLNWVQKSINSLTNLLWVVIPVIVALQLISKVAL